MDFLLKTLELLASIISVISAVVAVISSVRSKKDAKQAEQIRKDTELLYKEYLQSMRDAAQVIVQEHENGIEQNNQERNRATIKQAIMSFREDYFVLEDVERYLVENTHNELSRDSVVDILVDLEKNRQIKKLSSNGYHRFIR